MIPEYPSHRNLAVEVDSLNAHSRSKPAPPAGAIDDPASAKSKSLWTIGDQLPATLLFSMKGELGAIR
jgi:hypothetical protein